MRKLISGMKISLDGKTADAGGYANWVAAWSEDYGLTPQIDGCLLGADMYPGYEAYWTAIRDAPTDPLSMTGRLPTPRGSRVGAVRREHPPLCVVEHAEDRRVAEYPLPAQRRRCRRAQERAGQGHLLHRGRPNDRGSDGGGARRRTAPFDLPGDRRRRAVAVPAGGPARRLPGERETVGRRARRADLRLCLIGRARAHAAGRTGSGSGSAFACRCAGGATRRSLAATTKARPDSAARKAATPGQPAAASAQPPAQPARLDPA